MISRVLGVFGALCLAGGAALRSTADAQDAQRPDARALYWKGRYEEGDALFARARVHDVSNEVWLARCKLAVGKRAAAEQILKDAARGAPTAEMFHAELALLLLERGELDAAAAEAAAALAIDKDCVSARWVLAEVLKGTGKLQQAEQAYAWFTGYYNRAPRIHAEELLFIGRGVAEHARWTRNRGQFRRLVNDVYPQALTLETNLWPAHLQSALLFLEKYNESDAAAEIARGLAINPHAAELHAARAELALRRFELAAAKAAINRALEINPELLWAHQLQADWLLADLRCSEAIAVLHKALALNPREERTLGRLLAAYIASEPQGALSPRGVRS